MASVQFGNYQIMRKIGAGGMAQVFEAQRIGLEGFSRRVALKCILPEMTKDQRFVEMFVNEARLGSQLHHPNIVEIQDFNKVNDVYYIAMEYVEGVDLGEVIRRFRDTERDFPPGLAIDITLQALDGLGYAHEAVTDDGASMNIIHRDIKPSNLMLTNLGTVKIADFGIAKAATNAYQTRTSEVTKGSLAYMAPEGITREAPISAASDIFSLGAVLFEMLELRALFDGENMPSIMFKVAQVEIERDLSELEAHFPQFIPVLERALARDLEERYHSATEMAADLRMIRKEFPDELRIQDLVAEFIKPHFHDDYEEVGESTVALLGLDRDVDPFPRTNIADLPLRPPNITPPPAPIGSNPSLHETMYLPAQRATLGLPAEAGDSQPSLSMGGRKEKKSFFGLFLWGLFGVVAIGVAGGLITGKLNVDTSTLSQLLGGRPALLTIRSTPPGAQVFLDGVAQTRMVEGRSIPVITPAKLKLPDDGLAIIMLQKEGFEHFEQNLTYEKGQTLDVAPTLARIIDYGAILVNSSPSGATIFLDDKPSQLKTPAQLESLEAGKNHVVRLELDGYQTASAVVKVVKDDTVAVDETLIAMAGKEVEAPKRVVPTGGETSQTNRVEKETTQNASSGTTQGTKSKGTEEGTPGKETVSEPPSIDKGPPGTLLVNCQNEAECYIYVDNLPRAKAPQTFSLAPGTHKVRLETYDGSDSHSFKVEIVSGKEAARVWYWKSRTLAADDE